MSLHFQNVSIADISSSLFLGLASQRMNLFIEAQTNSMGFRSGDSAGVGTQLIPSLWMQALVLVAVCLGSLSWKNLCVDIGNRSLKYGPATFATLPGSNNTVYEPYRSAYYHAIHTVHTQIPEHYHLVYAPIKEQTLGQTNS